MNSAAIDRYRFHRLSKRIVRMMSTFSTNQNINLIDRPTPFLDSDSLNLSIPDHQSRLSFSQCASVPEPSLIFWIDLTRLRTTAQIRLGWRPRRRCGGLAVGSGEGEKSLFVRLGGTWLCRRRLRRLEMFLRGGLWVGSDRTGDVSVQL